jgi:hypothetical protein
MKITSLFTSTLLIGCALGEDYMECWTHGQNMPIATIKKHVKNACEGIDGKNGKLHGAFTGGQVKTACANDFGTRLEMTMQNRGSSTRSMTDTDCTKRFNLIIDHCSFVTVAIGTASFGGRREVDGWFFQ